MTTNGMNKCIDCEEERANKPNPGGHLESDRKVFVLLNGNKLLCIREVERKPSFSCVLT